MKIYTNPKAIQIANAEILNLEKETTDETFFDAPFLTIGENSKQTKTFTYEIGYEKFSVFAEVEVTAEQGIIPFEPTELKRFKVIDSTVFHENGKQYNVSNEQVEQELLGKIEVR